MTCAVKILVFWDVVTAAFVYPIVEKHLGLFINFIHAILSMQFHMIRGVSTDN